MSENITSMAIFTSINEISSIINEINGTIDTIKLYANKLKTDHIPT